VLCHFDFALKDKQFLPKAISNFSVKLKETVYILATIAALITQRIYKYGKYSRKHSTK
jgi:hypothetical protein